jgi:hypothetical protein
MCNKKRNTLLKRPETSVIKKFLHPGYFEIIMIFRTVLSFKVKNVLKIGLGSLTSTLFCLKKNRSEIRIKFNKNPDFNNYLTKGH